MNSSNGWRSRGPSATPTCTSRTWSLLYPETRAPVLSAAYEFVATLPYIPNHKLALTFGGSRSLEEIALDQIRLFTDTAGLPMTPTLRIVHETVEATATAWRKARS